MTQNEFYEKVALLEYGQVVEINADWFRAVKLPDGDNDLPCRICQMDSACREEVYDICCELEGRGGFSWYLEFAHP